MQFVDAAVPYPFEVTYDSPSLFVAMQVYNVTSGTPVFVNQVVMNHVYGNTYFGQFTPEAGQQYVINKAVFTDDTYTDLDIDYSQGSDSLRADDFAGIFLNALITHYQESGSVGEAIQTAAEGGGGGGGGGSVGLPLAGNIQMPQLVGIIEIEEIGGCP